MADNKDTKNTAETPADAARIQRENEQAGRTEQAMEAAKTPAEHEKASRTEDAPKANPETDDKPAADANPDEVNGDGDSWPNYMSTAGLNAIQRARVEGTPLDGQLGGAVLNPANTQTPSREQRKQPANAAAAKANSKK